MKQAGMTLLELMIVLAVSAILLGIGIPSFASLAHTSRLSSATNEMVSSLHLTRSEAIKRSSRVVMCTSATGTSCAASGGWDQGWVVFHDANNNASVDAGETVILAQPALPQGYRMKGDSKVSRYISYSSSGGTKHISGAFQAGALTLCNESGSSDTARKIIISSTGRARTVKVLLATCP
jgi:type IV fimbrial biogenesis protein FimT